MKILTKKMLKAGYVPKQWAQLITWIILNEQVFPAMDVFSLMEDDIIQNARIHLDQTESGSVSRRHRFHTWIGHHRVKTLTTLRIQSDSVQFFHHQ